MRSACVLWLLMLALVGVARADDDPALASMLGPSMLTCRLDGAWAACDVKAVRGSELQIFKSRGAAWERVGKGMGPMSAAMLLAYGCPEDVVRGFGFAMMGQEIAKKLRDTAGESQADSYVVCSLKRGFLARTFNSANPDVQTVWRYQDDGWKKLFSYASADAATAFSAHGISPYVRFRLLTGRRVPLDSWTPDL